MKDRIRKLRGLPSSPVPILPALVIGLPIVFRVFVGGQSGGGVRTPSRRIDELVWRALTDTTFREGLLNERRRELAAQMDLSDVEQQAVMAVRADTLEAFAGALCQSAERSA